MFSDKAKSNIIGAIVLILGIYCAIFSAVYIAMLGDMTAAGEAVSRGSYVAAYITLVDGIVLAVGDIGYHVYKLVTRKR